MCLILFCKKIQPELLAWSRSLQQHSIERSCCRLLGSLNSWPVFAVYGVQLTGPPLPTHSEIKSCRASHEMLHNHICHTFRLWVVTLRLTSPAGYWHKPTMFVSVAGRSLARRATVWNFTFANEQGLEMMSTYDDTILMAPLWHTGVRSVYEWCNFRFLACPVTVALQREESCHVPTALEIADVASSELPPPPSMHFSCQLKTNWCKLHPSTAISVPKRGFPNT